MREIQANIDRPMALQNYLRRTFPSIPPAILRKALENRDVRRRGTRLYPDELVYPDDELTLYIDDRYLDDDEPLDIVYEDKNLLLLNKKQGIAVVEERKGAPSLAARVQALYPEAVACHRLDYNTGGLVVFSRTNAAREQLEAAFRERTVRKFYRCLVWGKPETGAARVRAYLKKDAQAARVTIYDWAAPGAQPIETAAWSIRCWRSSSSPAARTRSARTWRTWGCPSAATTATATARKTSSGRSQSSSSSPRASSFPSPAARRWPTWTSASSRSSRSSP